MQAISNDERTWALLAHLSALVGYVLIPVIGNILAPLIIWQVKKDESWFIADQAKESLNFQLSMTLYAVIAGILVIILIGVFILLALYVVGIVMTVIGALKAYRGVQYRYPLTIRFL